MKIIDSWDTRANFWEVNPQLKVPQVFNKLYTEDKSKGKSHSSQLMWAIAFYADFDSKFRQLSDQERKDIVASDILRNVDFDWTTVEHLVQAWSMFIPVTKKQLMEWERFMNEKTIFMKTLSYDASTAEMIEKLLLSNSKLYKEFEDISNRLTQDDNTGVMMGGGKESLSEAGEI